MEQPIEAKESTKRALKHHMELLIEAKESMERTLKHHKAELLKAYLMKQDWEFNYHTKKMDALLTGLGAVNERIMQAQEYAADLR